MTLMQRFLFLSALLTLCACSKAQPIQGTFTDTFDRQELGSDWHDTSDRLYRISDGKLTIQKAYNHPLWLKRPLPRNAIIEFDVQSKTPDGDIKVEAWGDGKTYATTKGAYLASSYVFIFGGWGNRVGALCRLDEHANDRVERKDMRVETNRTYRFKITRQGNQITWEIDGKPFLSMNDPNPLEGDHHRYFGFNNWESALVFDNLTITSL